jgi:hypothetical protein
MKLQEMSFEQLATEFRNANYGDGYKAHRFNDFIAELRRRDEAVARLVEAGHRVREWMRANGYRDDDESFGLRSALTAFQEPTR